MRCHFWSPDNPDACSPEEGDKCPFRHDQVLCNVHNKYRLVTHCVRVKEGDYRWQEINICQDKTKKWGIEPEEETPARAAPVVLKPNSQPPEHTNAISLKGRKIKVIDYQLTIDIPIRDGSFSDPTNTTQTRMNLICKAAHTYFEKLYRNILLWADMRHFIQLLHDEVLLSHHLVPNALCPPRDHYPCQRYKSFHRKNPNRTRQQDLQR